MLKYCFLFGAPQWLPIWSIPSFPRYQTGDLLSPALFTILFDLLSRILSRAEQQGRIHGIKVGRACPPISHLMYADDLVDLVIYCRADPQEASAVFECLHQFCACSGQQINFSKSTIHFSSNTKLPTKLAILRTLGMVECNHKGSYLGLPFCRHQRTLSTFSELTAKVKHKLASWKARTLSFAGRGILVKTVIQSIPSYTMQTTLLPVKICKDIDGLSRDFWWGKTVDKDHQLYLKGWSSICAPKEAGGLGFRLMKDSNIAFLTKLVWQLNTRPDKLWVRLLHSKYLLGQQFLDNLTTFLDIPVSGIVFLSVGILSFEGPASISLGSPVSEFGKILVYLAGPTSDCRLPTCSWSLCDMLRILCMLMA